MPKKTKKDQCSKCKNLEERIIQLENDLKVKKQLESKVHQLEQEIATLKPMCNPHPVTNSSQPFFSYMGLPFSQFNVNKLSNEIKFVQKVGQRQVVHYGERSYSYGRTIHKPSPLPKSGYIKSILNEVDRQFPNFSYNSVLLTLYKDGQSFIPLHSDNEAEITQGSDILTISLGASRLVTFETVTKGAGPSLKLETCHGSVYSMSARSQALYKHGVLRDNTCHLPRVSITLRQLSDPSVAAPQDTGCSEASETSTTTPSTLSEKHVSISPNNITYSPCHQSKPIDTVFVSSSMFKHLDPVKLTTDKCTSAVFSYPGATAQRILKNLQAENSWNDLEHSRIKNIFVLCGTNDIDSILGLSPSTRNSVEVSNDNFDSRRMNETKEDMKMMIDYFEQTTSATINIINLLPRESLARNLVINDLNGFLFNMCVNRSRLNFIGTEGKFNMFTDGNGYRKSELFSFRGSDNVHLNSSGVIRLAKHLKYCSHKS